MGFDLQTLLTGILIFFARIVDVSLGTMRTISIVQGRTRIAFVLGFVEVSLWLFVIATILRQIMEHPLLGIFYALGFSSGNVLGILLERRLAFGHLVLRVVSSRFGREMAEKIRSAGFAVTTFEGEGMSGPVTLLYVVCRRRDMKDIVPIIRSIDDDAFYITEQAGRVSKLKYPSMEQATGFRALLKRK